jgi:hypothetical protein
VRADRGVSSRIPSLVRPKEALKPCHLCFQMEQDDSVRKLFVSGADK